MSAGYALAEAQHGNHVDHCPVCTYQRPGCRDGRRLALLFAAEWRRRVDGQASIPWWRRPLPAGTGRA